MVTQEVKHQIFTRTDFKMSVKADAPAWNYKDFDQAIKAGRNLCILDSMVLDMTDYVVQHPGGKFVLKINRGRDISKFFYGGYCLEDNLGPNPAQGYNHSNYAKLICNDLAIASYYVETSMEEVPAPETVVCRVTQPKTHMWNSKTGTVRFEAIDEKAKDCF